MDGKILTTAAAGVLAFRMTLKMTDSTLRTKAPTSRFAARSRHTENYIGTAKRKHFTILILLSALFFGE